MIPSVELANALADYYADPLAFVHFAWPWGVKGTRLENYQGPDKVQSQFLEDVGKAVRERGFDGLHPVKPIRFAAASGHGSGKSVLGAFLAWWILCTRAHSIGTVTAGTYTQLQERTWAAIKTWGVDCIASKGFDIQASGIFSKAHPESWKVIPQTCAPENAQSFAGQHAASSTSWYLFDEASEVPNTVYETADPGGLTDGEPMFFAWGQMVRSSGEFHKIMFGSTESVAGKWNTRIIDSRDSSFTNKEEIANLITEFGEDSDRVRVRVLGLPPKASEFQFISQAVVQAARKREHNPLDDEPLIVGMDAANGGLAWWTFWFRCGLDAKSIPPIRMPGDTPRESVISKAAEIMSGRHGAKRKQVAALFGDQAYGAVVIERLRALGFTNCFDINFGATDTPGTGTYQGSRWANMRSYMWDQMREWLVLGALVDDEKYEQQLIAPGGGPNLRGKLQLESKADMAKRGVASPDDADGLALTFARKVAVSEYEAPRNEYRRPAGPNAWQI